MRIVNSKNYSFSVVALNLILKFIEDNCDTYEPAILIGIDGGGCEFTWGDVKSQYFTIKVFVDYVDLESTLLRSGPGAMRYLTRDIMKIRNTIPLIQAVWYSK